MIARSSSSTRCAGATGPRADGWSWLRNARDSYHSTTHSVNPLDFLGRIADRRRMPRTPLLRALRRLADDHRAADRLGVPPEEAAYSRGEFLKRAGVAGAGLAAG